MNKKFKSLTKKISKKKGLVVQSAHIYFSDLQEPVHGSYILEVEEIIEQQE